MEASRGKIRRRILIPVILAVMVLPGATIVSVYQIQDEHINEEVRANVNNVQKLFQTVLSTDAGLMHGLIDFLEEDKKLQSAWVARDRAALLDYTRPIFDEIRSKYRVTHFYFHGLDRVCFLRVHNPGRYGDYIGRFTMAGAVEDGKATWGIELGPLGTFTLRVVQPWFIDGELAGYIELGEEIEHITPELREIMGTELLFVINKSYLNRSGWEEGMKMLGREANWEQLSKFVIVDSTVSKLPSNLEECLRGLESCDEEEHLNSLIEVSLSGQKYLSGFRALIDAGGRDVGDIVVMKNVTTAKSSLKILSMTMVVVCSVVCVLLGVLFYIYIGRIEVELVEAHDALTLEIEERKRAEKRIQLDYQNQAVLRRLAGLSLEESTLEEMLEQAIECIISVPWFSFESKGAIFLVEDNAEELVMKVQHGLAAPLKTICERVPFGRCVCGRVASSGEVQFVDCVDGRHENSYEGISAHGHYGVPIKSGSKVIGVINLYVKEGHVRDEKEEGFLCRVAEILSGIIERKKAEEKISDLAKFPDENPHPVLRVSAGGRILYSNKPSRVLLERWGCEQGGTLPKRWRGYVSGALKVGDVSEAEAECGSRVFSLTFSPVVDSGYVNIYASDITVRKVVEKYQAELLAKVESVNAELKDFAHIVSHDLKAPLRGVNAIANWIISDYGDKLDAEGKEQMDLLLGRVGRMHNLIEGVLAYSKAGSGEEEQVELDLNGHIGQVIDMIDPGENVAITVANELPVIKCSETRITQVFGNLLSNAVKYMDKPEGRVKIGCVEEDGFWKFSVADNGPGIEEKDFERIFKMFQTLSSRDEFESTGVGLTVVKKIVGHYGGKIWLESELGEGSTFYFTLPKQESEVLEGV